MLDDLNQPKVDWRTDGDREEDWIASTQAQNDLRLLFKRIE